MKHLVRIVVLTSLVLTSLLAGGAAFADDGGNVNPGLTPDNPFYFLDNLGKNISLFFTTNAEKKAAKALRYAEERLAEADALTGKNKDKAIEKAAKEYEKFLEKAEKIMDESANQDISDNVSERVAAAIRKHLEVLERVKENAPEKAREALERAREKSENGQMNALRTLAKNRLEKALEICDDSFNGTLERVKDRVKIRAYSGNTTAANVTAGLDYAERISGLEDELLKIAEEKGIDITALRERLSHSTANRLETLSGVWEKAPESARKRLEDAIGNSVKKYEQEMEKLSNVRPAKDNVTGNATAIQRLPEKLKEKMSIRPFIKDGPKVTEKPTIQEAKKRLTQDAGTGANKED